MIERYVNYHVSCFRTCMNSVCHPHQHDILATPTVQDCRVVDEEINLCFTEKRVKAGTTSEKRPGGVELLNQHAETEVFTPPRA